MHRETSTPRRGGIGRILIGILAGSVIAAAVIGIVYLVNRPNLPPLSRARIEQAMRQWKDNAVPNYDLDVKELGAQTGNIHVEVRGGQVVNMTRNGIEPKSLDAREAWTVPGMFEILQEELDLAEKFAADAKTGGGHEILLAQFDPKYGFPRSYRRVKLGPEPSVEWDVTRFDPAPQEPDGSAPKKNDAEKNGAEKDDPKNGGAEKTTGTESKASKGDANQGDANKPDTKKTDTKKTDTKKSAGSPAKAGDDSEPKSPAQP